MSEQINANTHDFDPARSDQETGGALYATSRQLFDRAEHLGLDLHHPISNGADGSPTGSLKFSMFPGQTEIASLLHIQVDPQTGHQTESSIITGLAGTPAGSVKVETVVYDAEGEQLSLRGVRFIPDADSSQHGALLVYDSDYLSPGAMVLEEGQERQRTIESAETDMQTLGHLLDEVEHELPPSVTDHA